LGLGVNSALQDVYYLGKSLETSRPDFTTAFEKYEANRLPESRALVRLVRSVFPYQYNHVPWRLKVSITKLLLQMMIHRISFGLIDEPTFRLSQNERIAFTELKRKKTRTDAWFYLILFGIIFVIGWLIHSLF